ncbi:hypothetical protein [Acidianus brierleyi]|jgi:hypothetical protein|uniref:Uncharacterized protein n=1 Tax=Acidianus brierleyi TaxID=41673 RepID=A0A2U9IHA0_9CREN|nr:hypothetical protein [Acidianus brierleyi]AWR95380.1 hypothetical protein DFR85_13010 [Acidianus brierleyi]PVU76470.1 hypothetical protein DDW12_10165 [Sulfolobus islandicus]
MNMQISNSLNGNFANNLPSQEQVIIQQLIYPYIALDNESGIIIRFSDNWSKVEYHEGKIVIYRDEDGKISIIEAEYDDEK